MTNTGREGLFIALFFVGLFAMTTTLLLVVDAYSCASAGRQMGKLTSYAPMPGCFVQIDGAWVPMDAYRVVEKK